ncbi:MAG: hypothetical protein HY741_08125 [Chloroflexi bacterium]|nr:hypothetical protein [Chloroflexota bacterium]
MARTVKRAAAPFHGAAARIFSYTLSHSTTNWISLMLRDMGWIGIVKLDSMQFLAAD